MEIINKISEVKVGMTLQFHYKKKPKDELMKYVEGIVDFIKDDKIRLLGFFKNQRFFKVVNFSFYKKIVIPDYKILLPDEIFRKSNTLDKNNPYFKIQPPKQNKQKYLIKNIFNKINILTRVRYYFPTPVSNSSLYQDCIIKSKDEDNIILEGLDLKDTRRFIISVPKDSEAEIELLNKKLKLPIEVLNNNIKSENGENIINNKKAFLHQVKHKNKKEIKGKQKNSKIEKTNSIKNISNKKITNKKILEAIKRKEIVKK